MEFDYYCVQLKPGQLWCLDKGIWILRYPHKLHSNKKVKSVKNIYIFDVGEPVIEEQNEC